MSDEEDLYQTSLDTSDWQVPGESHAMTRERAEKAEARVAELVVALQDIASWSCCCDNGTCMRCVAVRALGASPTASVSVCLGPGLCNGCERHSGPDNGRLRPETALVSCPDGTDADEPSDRGFVCEHEHRADKLVEAARRVLLVAKNTDFAHASVRSDYLRDLRDAVEEYDCGPMVTGGTGR